MENELTDTIQLCTYLGGSRMYKLDTEQSDYDRRGIFMNTRANDIVGLNRFKEHRKIEGDDDIIYRELLHFCKLITSGNTEVLEVLFAEDYAFSHQTELFREFRSHSFDFVNSESMLLMLRGYMNDELKLAQGIRKGKLGGKRFASVEKYGFSPKNFCQLFRLANVGITFFKFNRYVVDTREFGNDIYTELRNVKISPEMFTKEQLVDRSAQLENDLVDAYEKRTYTHQINLQLLHEFILRFYFPSLEIEYKSLILR